MITRVWRGWAGSAADADRYQSHYCDEVLPELHAIPGFRGARLLRHSAPDGLTEFVSLTEFDDMAAIHAFAGADPDVAVVADAARAALLRYDRHVTHYETAATT